MKKLVASVFTVFLTVFVFAQMQQPSIKAGQKVYEENCLSCHQADGAGVPHLNPPLIQTSYVTGDKEKLIKWVLQGSVEKLPIDGKSYTNNMPSQSRLKDKEIADVLSYIRNRFGNNSSAVTSSEVKAVRASLNNKGK